MKQEFSTASALALLGRCIAGGILVYAGFMKALAPPQEFAAALANYHLFPNAWLTPLSWGVPWFEIWAGLFLVAGLYTRWAAIATAGLYATFFGILSIAKVHHIDLASCGCFGAETLSPTITFRMDAAAIIISILLILYYRQTRAFTLDHTFSR